MGEWLYYNFVAVSFHTKNGVADFVRLKLNFSPKTEKSVFESPFGRLMGTHSVYSSIESPAQFPICHNRIFSLSLAVDTL